MKGCQPISAFGSFIWLIIGISACPTFVAHLFAQPAPNDTPRPNPQTAIIITNAVRLPPPAKSPVDFFRELLATDDTEREQRLAGRNPEDRKRILAKLQKYQALTPEERELRLRTTQLRWYLLPLMNTPATNRAAQLAMIPQADRKLVEERITQWDILPPRLQKEVLEVEITRDYFLGRDSDTIVSNDLQNLPANKRREVEEGLAHWNALPEEQRRGMTERFNLFFELTLMEKEKTLSTLSEPERQQMKKTLQAFAQLPKDQREQCVRSFGKFASMTAGQREQFLRNVERWQEMLPSEREAWRQLVRQVPEWPPFPP